MGKKYYCNPSSDIYFIDGENILMVNVSGGGWDGSIEGVGGKWGGLDADDSQYGL